MLVLCKRQMCKDRYRLLQNYPFKMKYLHTLDPDEIRELFRQEEDDYFRTVAELAAEDAAMERYYERKNQ